MKLHFISGLPRSGSTLLTSLLYQNPLVHTEGISALCEWMYQTHKAFDCDAIYANRRQNHAHKIISDLPNIYYAHTKRQIVFDKGRTWTFPINVEMLRRYVTPQPKIIVLTRDPVEIIASFKSLFARNGRDDFDISGMAAEFNHNMVGVKMAQDANDPATFLFVEFENLISNTQQQLDRIYDFLDIKCFKHDLANIVNMNPEDDSVYGLRGMHDVRRTIGKRDEV